MSVEYPGNVPSNQSKDPRYSVTRGDGSWQIRLSFRLSSRQMQLPAADRHPDLVEMVNAVKWEHGAVLGGAFYINEFLDVLVPVSDGRCLFAGIYQRTLEFEMGNAVIGPRAPSGLRPGDPWPGPHVGIRYNLKAGGRDIAYKRIDGSREVEHRLSDVHGPDAAAELARRLSRHKGDAGGQLFLNEAGEFFVPPPVPGGEYVYLGGLDEDLWFPPPELPRL